MYLENQVFRLALFQRQSDDRRFVVQLYEIKRQVFSVLGQIVTMVELSLDIVRYRTDVGGQRRCNKLE